MLNDLLTIERGLAARGIVSGQRHSDVKDMGRGDALRIRLSASGQIVDIDQITLSGRGTLWTLRDGQQNGFPGLKTASSLLKIDKPALEAHAKAWSTAKTSEAKRVELDRIVTEFSLDSGQILNWPKVGHRLRIGERYAQLAPLAANPLTAAVPAACERFLLSLNLDPSFLVMLFKVLVERIHNAADHWLEPARAVLIGPAALMIDSAVDDFERDASDPRQIGPVSDVLENQFTDGMTHGSNYQCALIGRSSKLHKGNFPQPNLPGLGQTYVFARNRDIPALMRYRRTADESFPVDAKLVGRLSGAILALTEEASKGRTWRLISRECGDKPDLLVASLARFPDLKLADALDGEDPVDGQSLMEELASRVLDQSEGKYNHISAQDNVIFLVLRTVDPANRKAIYHRRTTALAFHHAAKTWAAAICNLPAWLSYPLPQKGGARLATPPRILPLSIVSHSRTLFTNSGRRRVEVIGATASEAFGLFLGEGETMRRADALLRLLLKRHQILLVSLTQARAVGISRLKDFDPKSDLRRDALRSAAWLGALLYYLDRTREDYMQGAAFKLGQLLAAVDAVHIGYCADLRGGDVPPTLIGNSVFGIAGANPIRALAILRDRWKPYGAWARREDYVRTKAENLMKDADKKYLAWNMYRGLSQAKRVAPLCAELQDLLPQSQIKNAFKAELLLGYMAGLPPLPKRHGEDVSAETLNEGENS